MNKKYLFFALILSNFCNHYSFTMDNQPPSKIIDEKIKDDNRTKYMAKKDAYDALFDAAIKGNIDKFKSLLTEYKLDPNILCLSTAESLLDSAVSRHHADVAEYLIAQGADINLISLFGLSFKEWVLKYHLDFAIMYHRKPDIFKLFVGELVKRDKLAVEKPEEGNIFRDPETGDTLLHTIVRRFYGRHNYEYEKSIITKTLNELLIQRGPEVTLKYIQATNKTHGWDALSYRLDKEEIRDLFESFTSNCRHMITD